MAVSKDADVREENCDLRIVKHRLIPVMTQEQPGCIRINLTKEDPKANFKDPLAILLCHGHGHG
jgi:hypothetical protein